MTVCHSFVAVPLALKPHHRLKGMCSKDGAPGAAPRRPPPHSPRQHNAFGLQAAQCGSTVNRSSPFVRYSRLFSHSQELLNTHEDFLSRLSKPLGTVLCLPTATRVASTAATRSPRNCIPNWMRAEGAAPVARCAESHPRKRPCARAVPHDAPSPRRQNPRFCGSRLQRTSELASRRHAHCTAAVLRA